MSRRYAQPVAQVRTDPIASHPSSPTPIDVQCEPDGSDDVGRRTAPSRFLWRGRLYLVREVLAHWIEVDSWWHDLADADHRDREVWRVEAAAGRLGGTGVFDLCHDGDDRWILARAYD